MMFDPEKVIVASEQVEDSTYVFHSNAIKACKDVYKCEECYGTMLAGDSRYVENSQKVLHSKSVYDSINIVDCTNIYESFNLYCCAEMEKCSECRDSNCLVNCHFCANCFDLHNAMFCFNIHEQAGEYMLFNQPVSKTVWDNAFRQYQRMLTDTELRYYNSDWHPSNYVGIYPTAHANWMYHYTGLEEKFWNWVATLPGSDNTLIYNITCDPMFLGEKWKSKFDNSSKI